MSFFGKKIYNFLNKKWFFDKIYNEFFGQFFFKFGYSVSYKFIDRGIFEIMGPTGLSTTTLKSAYQIHKSQTKSLYHYTLIALTSLAILLCFRKIWLVFEYNIDYRSVVILLIAFFFINNNIKK
jgi:NADH:ubiquinone oxidoreductase subunit 5 (subunit L)/multisubunit Na+/H+ antiporter MnhA subunit